MSLLSSYPPNIEFKPQISSILGVDEGGAVYRIVTIYHPFALYQCENDHEWLVPLLGIELENPCGRELLLRAICPDCCRPAVGHQVKYEPHSKTRIYHGNNSHISVR